MSERIKVNPQIPMGNDRHNRFYLGRAGELTFNKDTQGLHIHDGVTPGGTLYINEAPKDGNHYVRIDGTWVLLSDALNSLGVTTT